jgi:HEAT repeat protein
VQDAATTDDRALALQLLQTSDSRVQLLGALILNLKLKNHPESTRTLIRLTQSPDPDMRESAIVGLLDSREQEVLPVLLASSRDSAASVRRSTAIALKNWLSPDSVSCLLDLLNDADQEVRTTAAASLGSLKAEEAIEPLVLMASSSNTAEREAALKALWAMASV